MALGPSSMAHAGACTHGRSAKMALVWVLAAQWAASGASRMTNMTHFRAALALHWRMALTDATMVAHS